MFSESPVYYSGNTQATYDHIIRRREYAISVPIVSKVCTATEVKREEGGSQNTII